MAICYFKILLYSLSISLCILFHETSPQTFNLTNLGHQVNITTSGDAYISTQGLQVTSNERNTKLQSQVGKATYIESLHLWDKTTQKLADFNTQFVFVIDSEGNDTFADGITFFLAPLGSNFTAGGAIGLPIDLNTSAEAFTSPFVAVEFDSYQNNWDPMYSTSTVTHVGIDVNSLISNVTANWYCDITNGAENVAWIRYNSSSHNLSVVVTSSPYTTSTIYLIVDLRDYLPEWVTFGFSGATGTLFEKNTVKSWEFSSSLKTNEINRTGTVDTENKNVTNPLVKTNVTDNQVKPGSNKISLGAVVGIVVGSGVLLGGFVLIGFGLWRSRAKEEDMSENVVEAGAGPKKFSYSQLSNVTKNFDEGEKLGQGAFGKVYKGFSTELNSSIAVKRISDGSKQGIKEYAAEVNIISQLSHKNLVKLHGWCRENKELLLVYEFMENASLDSHLFKGKSLLEWETRFKIAQGLASALLYLHEECGQVIVHRDIKSSNVLLDSNFNAKLGDFGLARFVDHQKGSHASGLAGTMGYLAPEYITTSKATKESDVYSFGVVMLEIACGRKPYDEKVPECQRIMVEWVWDLYGMKKLLEAADPKLGPNFNKQEMERLMTVGLWCVHPDHKLRPKIGQAIHVLTDSKAPLPTLPPKLPEPIYVSPPLNTALATTSSNTSQNHDSSNTDSSKFTSSSI